MRDTNTSLDVRIPISASPHYFNRVRLIARSIREFYPRAQVRVTVSADKAPFEISKVTPWSKELGVTWDWVPSSRFNIWRGTEMEYVSTITERYRPPFFAEYVLMLDADVLPVRPFDELFEHDGAMLGMMAHASPLPSHREDWQDLFTAYGVATPRFEFEHSGWGSMVIEEPRRFAPVYFNSGVIFARAAVLERFFAYYQAALDFIRGRMNTYFFDQIAITLALYKSGLPFGILPLRYNFPNQPEFDALHPRELEDVRFIHFLRTNIISRENDFVSDAALARLVARVDLTGSNEALRQRLETLVQI